jgi:hypothetical protein
VQKKLKYPVLILAMLLLVSSFSASFVQVAFSVNRNYIIKELCENRSRPQMHCDGKCYLRKNIQKQEDKSAPASTHKNHSEVLNWLFTGNVLVQFDSNKPATSPVDHFADFLSIGFILSVDHPPPAIS